MANIDIMQDNSEIIHYDKSGIPLSIRITKLSSYPNKQALCHWHDDIEFIYILKGKMNYSVNGKKILLNEQDCIMINSRQMHYGYSFQQQECNFICILFHPNLFTANKLVYKNYITPILENPNIEYFYFDSKNNNNLEIKKVFDKIVYLKKHTPPAYELEIIGILHIFWSRLLQNFSIIPKKLNYYASPDLIIQKNMVSYIYQHYTERLSLSDIASSGTVCRNKCCLIFKHYLKQSPIEFLNSYRLKISCNLLINTSDSITEIAFACGFNHLSYYSKLFFRNYGCTPSEYRKLYLSFTKKE